MPRPSLQAMKASGVRVWKPGYVHLVHSATNVLYLYPLKLLGERFCVLVTFDEQVSFLAGVGLLLEYFTPQDAN